MRTTLRNSFNLLRRFKMAIILNVLGLSIAFVAFMLIMIQVNYDQRFDSCQKNASSIFRMDLVMDKSEIAIISRPFARAFTESSPHIKAGGIMAAWTQKMLFDIEQNGQRVSYNEEAWNVSPGILDVFQFDMVEGSTLSLSEPSSVIIPKSMANKFFGNESAIGKQLLSPIPEMPPLIVKGVFMDFPRNSSLKNSMYTSMHPQESYDDWDNWSYLFFVRLDDPANKDITLGNFNKNYDVKKVFEGDLFGGNGSSVLLRLTSLPELHFLKNVDFDTMPKASHQTILVLFSIALIIIIISAINFTNFSTALTPMRIKSINTQKVLGSPVYLLRGGLLIEAVLISLFAYLISVVLLYAVQKTQIALFIEADMTFGAQSLVILGTAIIAVFVGLLAGLYPAYYVTSFPPVLALKGSFGLSASGRRMRSLLVGIQFVASFILIIGALFMSLQNHYMQNAPMGYDKDEMIVAHLNNDINNNRDAFANRLKTFAGVEDVTYSQYLLSSQDQYMGWGRDYNGKSITFESLPVSSSFLKVMGIEVTDGRGFRLEDDLKETGSFIFNEEARAQYDLKLNEKLEGAEIIGFIPNIKFASFRQKVSPMAFYLWGKFQWGQEGNNFDVAYVKFKAGSDLRAGMKHVRESLAKFNDEYPFDVRFFDDVLQQTYEQELKMGTLITLFSIIAIFISIVGVFGLVLFESEYRRKEIALRKVLGSTTGQILGMFNMTYFRILLVCFVFGAPAAWYAIDQWLGNFAYRTPMHWWVLPIAFFIIGVITTITVSFQIWYAANENPVKNLKTE